MSSRVSVVFIALLIELCSAFGATGKLEKKLTCGICGMTYESGTAGTFESLRKGQAFPLCSFTCAHAYHQREPKAQLFTFDFKSHEKRPADDVFYLVRSQNVLKEIEFSMPPTVVAFGSREEAAKAQRRLNDGKIIHGFAEVEHEYSH